MRQSRLKAKVQAHEVRLKRGIQGRHAGLPLQTPEKLPLFAKEGRATQLRREFGKRASPKPSPVGAGSARPVCRGANEKNVVTRLAVFAKAIKNDKILNNI